MKTAAFLFMICAVYCGIGCGIPDNQVVRTPKNQSGINWRLYDAPGLNSMYILTIDSVEYIVVLTPHGVSVTPKIKK